MKRVRPPLPSIAPSAFDQAAPLSPFLIRKLAGRKGFTADSVMKARAACGSSAWPTARAAHPSTTRVSIAASRSPRRSGGEVPLCCKNSFVGRRAVSIAASRSPRRSGGEAPLCCKNSFVGRRASRRIQANATTAAMNMSVKATGKASADVKANRGARPTKASTRAGTAVTSHSTVATNPAALSKPFVAGSEPDRKVATATNAHPPASRRETTIATVRMFTRAVRVEPENEPALAGGCGRAVEGMSSTAVTM